MLKSFKSITEKIKQFHELDTSLPIEKIMSPVGNLQGNVDPGDIIFFRYKTVSRGRPIDSFFICLASRAQGFSRSFKISPKSNTLLCAFEVDLASPETLIATVAAIYKNRQATRGRLTDEGAKRMIASVLGIKQFKTFNILYMSSVNKLDMDYLIESYNNSKEIEEDI